jgi:hypothetical protein
VNELVDTLLYEGYALYPYTPGATKNATPTPFGIVYPPAYAAGLDTTFDYLELRCVVEGGGEVEAEVRFLAPSGERHRAEPRRIEGEGEFDLGHLSVRTRLEMMSLDGDRRLVSYRVDNRTEVEPGLDRAAAIERSLISTHPLLRVAGGRFISQLDAPCESVNTWPVLASPADDVMLGAAIVLPDHPQIAPESRGNLFDNTEIEEALVLHVQVLSDEERAQIAEQDPAVREMIERASAVTPQELSRLHGRVTLSPPQPSSDLRDPTQGLAKVEVDGVVFRRGGRVVVRSGLDADLQARMLEGRTVTVERIQRDYDGRVHLGVALDEPGQEILRETGRFLWLFPPEVEVVSEAEPRGLASMDAERRHQGRRQDGGAS